MVSIVTVNHHVLHGGVMRQRTEKANDTPYVLSPDLPVHINHSTDGCDGYSSGG